MSELPYRALWRREVAGGMYGQQMAVTASWKLDGLWRAACLQYQAEETYRMLRDSLDANDHPETIQHFLDQYEAECAACHAAFLADQGGTHAAA